MRIRSALFSGLLASPLLAGCIESTQSPWVGECAEYPATGTWEYGQIGIGTCLAAPADLVLLDRDDARTILVSNSNAFRDFQSGSVLAIDWDSIDFSRNDNRMSDLSAVAATTEHYPGTLAEIPGVELLAVPTRYSEDARTRQYWDDLTFFDLTDPLALHRARVAEDGTATLEVQSDPWATAYDSESGYLYVGNRTSHSVSVVDALAKPVALVDAYGDMSVGYERWMDDDNSGSKAAFSVVEVLDDEEYLDSQTWTLTWVDGTYRTWIPEDDGVRRYESGGDGTWTRSGYGVELLPEDLDGVADPVEDPYYYESANLGPRMLFQSGADLWGAVPYDYLADWVADEDPLLAAEEGSWDDTLSGPALVNEDGVSYLFYDGTGEDGTWIGLATSSTETGDFEREGDEPLLEPGGDFDSEGQAMPHIVWDSVEELWRMYYAGWDGSRWRIGLAWSEDLETWEPETEPVFSVESGHAAHPVVVQSNGRYRLYFSRGDLVSDIWHVGEAVSVDGLEWTDLGSILTHSGLNHSEWGVPSRPPGLALDVIPYETFRVEGTEAGDVGVHVTPGVTVESSSYNWKLRTVAGQLADLEDVGDAAANGLGVSSVVLDSGQDSGQVWLDLVDAEGDPAVGTGTWDGESLVPDPDPVLEAGEEGDFDEDGVSSPVVRVAEDGTWILYYAGWADGVARIGRATSSDGESWSRESEPVLDVGEDWDSLGVIPGSVEATEDGEIRLWYGGHDGERYRIGLATSAGDGVFERYGSEEGEVFGPGSPGDWDDTSVAAPFALSDEEGTVHLWYQGYDGSTWRIGYASADADTLEWARYTDADDDSVAVLAETEGRFDYSGVGRPVVVESDTGWLLFYRGLDSAVFRPGLAHGASRTAWYKAPRIPTAGDWLSFSTVYGESGTNAISLDQTVDGYSVTGTGMSAMHLDSERGYLYVASKLHRYLMVVDVRDDSEVGFDDRNYLDYEAAITYEVAAGSEYFRSMLTVPGSPYLYALSTSPEAVYVFDLDRVEDDGLDDLVEDALVGVLATPRGGEEDRGVETVAETGPAGLALHPDGTTLYVTNYNDNSLSVFDLRMGTWGALVGEVPFICENPFDVQITPDGSHGVVSCFEGEVEEDRVQSQLAVVDTDPDSESWLEVLTWIGNE